jgi:hypothetical protein
MGVNREIWAREFAKNLFPDNSHISKMRNEDDKVSFKTVHRLQSGAVPTVLLDDTSVRIDATERADTVVKYDLHEFKTVPSSIKWSRQEWSSADVRADIQGDHVGQLDTRATDFITYANAATGGANNNIVRTTGGARPAGASLATGNRKAFTKTDLRKARALMNKMNVPKENRYCVLPAEFEDDLLSDDQVLNSQFMNMGNLPEGVIGKLYGFNIMTRASVATYTTGLVPKSPFATGAATDHSAAFCFQTQFAAAALGAVKVFYNADDPNHHGDVFSAAIIAGGSKVYENERGIVCIVEDVAA